VEAQQALAAPLQPQIPMHQPPTIKANIYWLNPDPNSKIRAAASLKIGDAYAVHGIKVNRGPNGDFVSMPSYQAKDGYRDIFHATTKEAREQIKEAVMTVGVSMISEKISDGLIWR